MSYLWKSELLAAYQYVYPFNHPQYKPFTSSFEIHQTKSEKILRQTRRNFLELASEYEERVNDINYELELLAELNDLDVSWNEKHVQTVATLLRRRGGKDLLTLKRLPNYENNLSGIYFLILDDKIMYVGQSANILDRIGTHNRKWNFESFKYILCRPDQSNNLERLYIKFLQPPWNIKGLKPGAKNLDTFMKNPQI